MALPSDGVRVDVVLAAEPADERGSRRPPTNSASAQKVQARSNAAAASSGDGVPMIATTIATPSAAPT